MYIKSFDALINGEFLVAEILPETTFNKINEYVGQIHLIETVSSSLDNIIGIAIVYKPDVSTSFKIYNYKDDKLRTEYGFYYKILYRTKDKNDAISKYEMYSDSKKYNL
jgi:hypothetical protein